MPVATHISVRPRRGRLPEPAHGEPGDGEVSGGERRAPRRPPSLAVPASFARARLFVGYQTTKAQRRAERWFAPRWAVTRIPALLDRRRKERGMTWRREWEGNSPRRPRHPRPLHGDEIGGGARRCAAHETAATTAAERHGWACLPHARARTCRAKRASASPAPEWSGKRFTSRRRRPRATRASLFPEPYGVV